MSSVQSTNDMTEKKENDFPIVGIGASAGGLAAFETFFSGMPANSDPGMAFVLVQHLAPNHKSILTELIKRYTRMKVFEVEDGMQVQPNCTYIIPPNRDMAFLNGTLQLLEPNAPHGQRLPIDFFFRSLAHDQHEKAIGVVLSGTGSDGTLGVRAIKGEGGMVIAQTPDSAEYDGMPRNAIATGLVDYELPVAEMAEKIIAYVTHAGGNIIRHTSQMPKAENLIKKILVLLRSRTGHDFSGYKHSTIQRRIERRMAVNQITGMESYVHFVLKRPEELDALFRDMLIGVTNFFRDPESFKNLEENIIPKLFFGKNADALIRLWVPGCSTGEEAYSLAILLAERKQGLKKSFRIQVFATDIDRNAIATARAGIYPASIVPDLTPGRLNRFFTPEPGNRSYRIHKEIRDMLIFSEQNVISDPPFSKLDLISCRNLLIYLGAELQNKIFHIFHYALNPGGFLFLGTSETLGENLELFSPLDRQQKIYQRKNDFISSKNEELSTFLPSVNDINVRPHPPSQKTIFSKKKQLRELTEQTLLRQIVQLGALVNAQGDILYLYGQTGKYLEPTTGESGINNILKMAREGLSSNLAIALHEITRTQETVYRPGLTVKTNGDFTTVNLIVKLVTSTSEISTEPPLYLVMLEQSTAPRVNESEADSESNDHTHILELKQELRIKEEYLQSTVEELNSSNEELQSSNEELQSVNEELQSTNEELETSKEELQSVNEELTTVNSELQTKVADLSQANNDMNNLLAGTGIATIFVDHQLRILRFTPTATKIINLIKSDIGRSVGHIVNNLSGYTTLVADIQEVLDTLISKEIEVQTTDGQWYTMRILPYRTIDNIIEGAVLTFVEITEAHELRESLRMSAERMRVALSIVPLSVFNQDRDLRYTWFRSSDPAFSIQQIIGKTDADLLQEQEAVALNALKKQVLESGKAVRKNIQATIEDKKFVFDLLIEPLRDATGAVVGITCASIDITRQHDNKQ